MSREKIMAFIREKGPVIPSQIAKEVGTNILFSSAMLSELVARKELMVSKVKVGGSPLYYIRGQEVQLEKYSGKLNEKELQAFELLKERQLLRDTQQSPVIRVALRSLKDFAVPLEVSFNNQTEIFWKWYTLDTKEAEQRIRSQLTQLTKPAEEVGQAYIPQEAQEQDSKVAIEKPKKAEKAKQNKNELDTLLNRFFEQKDISAERIEKKKNGESEGFLTLKSPFGEISYYYIAKNKKTLTEKDMSEALAKSQLNNISLVIFSNGQPNKKAQQMLQKFKMLHFTSISQK